MMTDLSGFDAIQKRMTALWDRELIDRCCCAVFATGEEAEREFNSYPSDNEEENRKMLVEPEWMLRKHLDLFEHTYFAGDAFPLINLNLGPAGHTAFLKGVRPMYRNTSIWYSAPLEEDEELYPEKIVFDPEAYLYRQTFAAAEYLVNEANGRYMVSMPDVSGDIDVLGNIRTTMNLMIDLVSDEDAVHESLDKIQKIWREFIPQIYEIVRKSCLGGSCIGWLHTWAPGFHSQMQADMSVMFSNELYEEFIRKELEEDCSILEYPLYHFDGQEQIRHLDTLLSIENLKMIQWTPVAGQPSPVKFIPQLKRIQSAGKCLHLILKPNEVEPIMTELSSKGLFLLVNVRTKDEADDMMKLVTKLTRE